MPPPAATKPHQLPADLPRIAGQADELHRLDRLLAGADTTTGGPTVVIISGAAGVGKTTFAVHWARQVRDRFPDGQLYVDLHQYRAGGTGAIRPLLDALGVASQRIPTSQDGQVNLYRSLLADKRILVMLDDAATAEQIRPLLPGAPGCLVVITSRDRLTSLVATNGAQSVILQPTSTVDKPASDVGPVRWPAREAGPTSRMQCATA
jgi:hypothetical protein